MPALVASVPVPKSYSGFRMCLARLVNPVVDRDPRLGRLCLLLRNTGYEAGEFLNEIFYAWDSFRLEGMNEDAWVLAWDQVHDAFINACDGGERMSQLLMSCRPV